MRLAALAALAALALVGCESSQEKSAKIERVAKREARETARQKALTQRSLSIAHPSSVVKVLEATVLHSGESAAVAVVLRNTSASALRGLPIRITVRDASGATVYTNATAGLASSLVSVPLLPAHSTSTWVDDQVQPSAAPAGVGAEVGEGERLAGASPDITVKAGAIEAEGGEGKVAGTVTNHSSVQEREPVVYVIARRAGRITAAGRAVVPRLQAGATQPFQAFLIGNAQGAHAEASIDGIAAG